MDNQNPNKKLILILVFSLLFIIFIIFLIVSGWLFFSVKKQTTEIKRPAQSTILTPTVSIQKKAAFELKTLDNITHSVGQPLTLQIIADSGGEEIVGFDVLLTYDSLAFDFIEASSLLPDFKVYSYKKENYISLTAIKSLQSKAPSVFKNEPVIKVDFIPKKAGLFKFVMEERIGKETAGLVNTKTERITPLLKRLMIEIQ